MLVYRRRVLVIQEVEFAESISNDKLMHLLQMRKHYCHKSSQKQCRMLEVTAFLYKNGHTEFKYGVRF